MKSFSKLLQRISSAASKSRQFRNRTEDSLHASYLRATSSSPHRHITFSSPHRHITFSSPHRHITFSSPHTPSSRYPIAPPPTSAISSFNQVQRRTMFIQTQSTPNPSSLMFYPGKEIMEVGSADFPNARAAMNSPLAKAIYAVDGVTRVFFGSDFVTVTKSDDFTWDIIKPQVFAAIMDFYSSGKPLFLDSNNATSTDTVIKEDDSETVAMIKELLETRIRPAVQDDGGDIEYRGFDIESGIVKLKMQGACSGCPSSAVTLKSGIENMLMHYVPEVKSVEQEFDEDEEAAAVTGGTVE